MKLEARRAPLLPRQNFITRQVQYAAMAALVGIGSLSIGIVGYHVFGHLDWVDSLLNASFILTGMGPVDPMKSVAGKLFASGYAIFSGVAFLTTIGILTTPIVHRILHRFHLEEDAGR
ncbi:MAG TPA: hypothetical protein VE981_03980 [Planctomycetota bacterium]|nr:hypothetical protein [Planctomycetota bacterium]